MCSCQVATCHRPLSLPAQEQVSRPRHCSKPACKAPHCGRLGAEMMATASARLAAASGRLDLAVQAAQQLHMQAGPQRQEGPRLRTFVPALMLAAHQGAPDAAAQV